MGYVKTASPAKRCGNGSTDRNAAATSSEGKEIFQKQVRRLQVSINDNEVAKLAGFAALDDLFMALGNGTVTVAQIAERLSPKEVAPEEEYVTPPTKAQLRASRFWA